MYEVHTRIVVKVPKAQSGNGNREHIGPLGSRNCNAAGTEFLSGENTSKFDILNEPLICIQDWNLPPIADLGPPLREMLEKNEHAKTFFFMIAVMLAMVYSPSLFKFVFLYAGNRRMEGPR